MPRMTTHPTLDLAIIGGGIAGLIHLHYARRAGLRVVLLERAPAVGGLWRELPSWQDIQICPVDWTVGDLPIAGPLQPQVLANIESWVSRFGLAPDIRTGCAVTGALLQAIGTSPVAGGRILSGDRAARGRKNRARAAYSTFVVAPDTAHWLGIRSNGSCSGRAAAPARDIGPPLPDQERPSP